MLSSARHRLLGGDVILRELGRGAALSNLQESLIILMQNNNDTLALIYNINFSRQKYL